MRITQAEVINLVTALLTDADNSNIRRYILKPCKLHVNISG